MVNYNYEVSSNIQKLAFDICKLIATEKNPPVFLCVGDSHFVSDSLGPMVGSLLSKQHNIPAFVYGNLDYNITSKNLLLANEFIKQNHKNSKIFVIDACLSDLNDFGTVSLQNNGAILGGYTNEKAGIIGNLSLLGTINTKGINSLMFLTSTKLKNTINMANFIAQSISQALQIKTQLNKVQLI